VCRAPGRAATGVPALHRAHTRDQFTYEERLHHVVVSAEFESDDLFRRAGSSAHDYDGYVTTGP
jgi:hypothetical protein